LGARGDATSSVKTFRELEVARIPVGPAPEQIGVATCEDCAENCEVGFAFLGLADDLYFYDVVNANLKVVRGIHSKPVVSILPGIRTEFESDRPYDGCIAPDSTMYLLADRGSLEVRFLIYYRRPDGSSWQVADPLNDDAIGWTTIGDHRIPSLTSVESAPPLTGMSSSTTLTGAPAHRSLSPERGGCLENPSAPGLEWGFPWDWDGWRFWRIITTRSASGPSATFSHAGRRGSLASMPPAMGISCLGPGRRSSWSATRQNGTCSPRQSFPSVP
jgi:hypothetical protein